MYQLQHTVRMQLTRLQVGQLTGAVARVYTPTGRGPRLIHTRLMHMNPPPNPVLPHRRSRRELQTRCGAHSFIQFSHLCPIVRVCHPIFFTFKAGFEKSQRH